MSGGLTPCQQLIEAIFTVRTSRFINIRYSNLSGKVNVDNIRSETDTTWTIIMLGLNAWNQRRPQVFEKWTHNEVLKYMVVFLTMVKKYFRIVAPRI